MSSLITQRRS